LLAKILGCICLMAQMNFAATAPAAESGRVQFLEMKRWVEPETGPHAVGQPLRYSILVRWRLVPGASLHVRETPELHNLRCAGYSTRQFANWITGEAATQFHFTLVPLDSGAARIGKTFLDVETGQPDTDRKVSVEGLELEVGSSIAARSRRLIGLGGAGVAVACLALAGGLLMARRKPPRIEPVARQQRVSPLAEQRRSLQELERVASAEDSAGFYERVRTLLLDLLRRAGAVDRPATSGEFGSWLERQDATRREQMAPALALLEQVERVRFGGWTPTMQENSAAFRELEIMLERLEADGQLIETKERQES